MHITATAIALAVANDCRSIKLGRYSCRWRCPLAVVGRWHRHVIIWRRNQDQSAAKTMRSCAPSAKRSARPTELAQLASTDWPNHIASARRTAPSSR
jgi:hypothetical protein